MYFDTHAHYDDEAFDKDRDALIQSLPDAGIALVLNPGADMASSRTAVALSQKYSHMYAAVGVHPHEAKQMIPADFTELEALSKHDKVMAIGEIGLDYFYDHSPRDIQKQRFRDQMALAQALKLPVIIHDRDAHEDCLQIVKEFRGVCGVYHCYSGSWEMAKILLNLGYYLSFNGVITFKNARRSLEVIQKMPLDRLMLETDAPYLSPVPYRGKRNDSTRLPLVAETIAALLGQSAEEIGAITMANGRRFFNIP